MRNQVKAFDYLAGNIWGTSNFYHKSYSTTMKNTQFKLSLFLILASILFSSCASGYKLIEPEKAQYVSISETREVEMEYKYDVLSKKYEKKARRKGIQVIALKFSNNSPRDLKFGTDIKLFYENGKEIVPMDKQTVYNSLRQRVAPYLFYLLLTPARFNIFDERGRITSSTPVGLLLGPGLTGLNMGKAITGNERFDQELIDFDINGSIIKAGETRYGLIGIHSSTYDALEIQVF